MFATLALLALTAQVGQTPVAGESLERIRRKLAEPPPRLTVETDLSDITRPKFRLSIEAFRPLFLDKPWESDDTAAPSYVRAPHPLYHQEFLNMVTPEEFRAGTAVGGIELLALARAFKEQLREARERRARERVRKELKEFKAANGIP